MAKDVGVVATIGALAAWAVSAGSVYPSRRCTSGPTWCAPWLVLYTRQHTDVDVPEGDQWNLVKGAFMTIDRPWVHIRLFAPPHGSTHVAHHINHHPALPRKEATEALKEAFPDLYLYDPTPIVTAT